MSPPTHEPISAAASITSASAHAPDPGAAADITGIPASPIPPSSPSPPPISEPEPELKPLIAEVLRTRYCAPGSVVLVEGVDIAHTTSASKSKSRSGRSGQWQSQQTQTQTQRQWRAVRLLLGDGELCIQALLAPEMHPYVDAGEVAFGSYIRLERFRIQWLDGGGGADASLNDADVDVKGKGKAREEGERMVYLVVEDLLVVGWSKDLFEMGANASEDLSAAESDDDVDMVQYGTEPSPPSPELSPSPSRSRSLSPSRAREERRAATASTTNTANQAQQRRPEEPPSAPQPQTEPPFVQPVNAAEAADLTTDSDFEVMSVTRQEKVEQNRVASTTTNTNNTNANFNDAQTAIAPPRPAITTTTTAARLAPTRPQPPNPPRPRQQPLTNPNPTHPLKLTPLKQIPHLPYKQNWRVNVLAIIASLSTIEPSGIPPYTNTQRRARLADPSTPKRVLLTVFLDAEEFAPVVGSVVLLVGVKNHRFDGGSLKKYESDRVLLERGDGDGGAARWWFENPEGLGWCDGDVRGLKEWWEGEQQRQGDMQM